MTRTAWLVAALAVSLAINLFAATFVAGAWSQRGASLNVGGLLPGGSALRQDVRAALAQRRDDIAQALGRLQQARRTVLETASSPDFDREAMQDALAELRAATGELQAIAQDALLTVVEQASPEQRRDFNPNP